MNQPFRTPGVVVPEKYEEKTVKSSSWRHGNLQLRWDLGSGFMEVGVFDHSGVTVNWTKIDDDVAYDLADALNTAATEI